MARTGKTDDKAVPQSDTDADTGGESTAPETGRAEEAALSGESAAEDETEDRQDPAEPGGAPPPGTTDQAAKAPGDVSRPQQPTREADSAAAPAMAPPAPRGSAGPGYISLVLVGAVAAALGAGAVLLTADRGWLRLGGQEIGAVNTAVEVQASRVGELEQAGAEREAAIADLRRELEALSADLAGRIEAQNQALAGSAGRDELSEVSAGLSRLQDRLNQLEVQPIPEAQLPDEVAAAYDAKLAEVRQALDGGLARIEATLDARMAATDAEIAARIEALEAAARSAAEAEALAADAQAAAATREAFARMSTALNSGTAFRAALDEVTERSGLAAPEVLRASADSGVPSLESLRTSFPDAARSALAAATREAADNGAVGGVAAFLRTQLGVRSLEPREGDDPDAVLSRAEAALRQGDLPAALAEIGALSESGRAEMASWVQLAQTRRDALDAAAALGAQIDSK